MLLPFFNCARIKVMKKIIFSIVFIFCFGLFSGVGVGVEAEAEVEAPITGYPAGAASYGSDEIGGVDYGGSDPLGVNGKTTIQVLIGRVIRALLGVVGSLALAMFVYGGLTWMTAAGASDRVTKGKDILVWATIGLIVVFSSYMLVRFVIGTLSH